MHPYPCRRRHCDRREGIAESWDLYSAVVVGTIDAVVGIVALAVVAVMTAVDIETTAAAVVDDDATTLDDVDGASVDNAAASTVYHRPLVRHPRRGTARLFRNHVWACCSRP